MAIGACPEGITLNPTLESFLIVLSRGYGAVSDFFQGPPYARLCTPWGSIMKDLVIELILIAMIVIPLVAESREPCRATNRHGSQPRRM